MNTLPQSPSPAFFKLRITHHALRLIRPPQATTPDSTFGFRISALALGYLLLALGTASAYPPTLYHTICGLVRDELGDPITSTNAQIVFQTSAGTTLSTTIVPFLGAGINYRLKVPMDAGLTADNYQGSAQRTKVPFLLTVKIGPTTYHPIQMQGGYANLGKPGQKTWLDLTLGEDTLGDGIPDAWKWMVLEMSDGYYTDISQIQPNGRFPGYPMTMLQAYIAGTYVWDPSDVFSLLVVGMNGNAPVVAFQVVQGRSYSIAATTDFHQWTPVQVRQAFAASASLINSYVATDTGQVQLEVPPSTSSPTNQLRFFRATVQ